MEGMTLTNLCAQPYCSRVGFTGDSQTYEIIGIYRQSNLWEADSYSVTPNTVFVPNASLAALLQLLLLAFSLWLSAAIITRRSPLDNLRTGNG